MYKAFTKTLCGIQLHGFQFPASLVIVLLLFQGLLGHWNVRIRCNELEKQCIYVIRGKPPSEFFCLQNVSPVLASEGPFFNLKCNV